MSSHIQTESKDSSQVGAAHNVYEKKEFTVVIAKLPDTAPSRVVFSLPFVNFLLCTVHRNKTLLQCYNKW